MTNGDGGPLLIRLPTGAGGASMMQQIRSLERGADNAYRLNARWQPSRFDLTQRNRVTTADGQRDDSLEQHFRRPFVELGGDITRPLAGGAIKLVGLATRRKRDDTHARGS